MRLKECRACRSTELSTFLDLGESPISNSYQGSLNAKHQIFPLKVMVCKRCEFLQLSEVHDPSTHFNDDYPYFSGYSSTWVDHCFKSAWELSQEFELSEGKLVLEIASNDGTFISKFKEYGADILGIEPSQNVAKFAIDSGVPTIVDFFSRKLALGLVDKGLYPDLIIACNVLAHVPDINDFLAGLSVLLDNNAVAILEFPHATRLIRDSQFDTIYHEHYSYINATPLVPILETNGLRIFRITTHELHGGSLRIFICRMESELVSSSSVKDILDLESKWKPTNAKVQIDLYAKVSSTLIAFREKLEEYQELGYQVIAFGAAAKGTTLLNIAQIDSRLIKFAVDSSKAKQGKFIPGTDILIRPPEVLVDSSQDRIVILAWNFAEEIINQANLICGSRQKYLIPIPTVEEC
jgi:SAM-dependent methyltransferase